MQDPFQVVICDPPYRFSDTLSMDNVKRGAAANYKTLSIDEIKSLPVPEIVDPNGCILALWVPSSLLTEGLDIMKAWGFTQKQTYVWVKNKKQPFKKVLATISQTLSDVEELDKRTLKKALSHVADVCKDQLDQVLQFGLGRLFRQTHEIALIGTNNNGIYSKLMNRSQRSVSFATNLKHSMKPETLHQSLEIMFPDTKKLEIFARRERDSWTCIGNQVAPTMNEDVRDSLNHLISQ